MNRFRFKTEAKDYSLSGAGYLNALRKFGLNRMCQINFCLRPGAPTGFFSGEGHRRRKRSVVAWGRHGECGARAYNGVLGAEPPAGPRAKPLVKGSGGKAP